jgi:hypothetical protein
MLYDLKEGRSLNVLNYDIETEASLRVCIQMISTISITLELEKIRSFLYRKMVLWKKGILLYLVAMELKSY